MKTWVKLYTKGLDSPDTGSLSWAHRGIFDALLQLAGRLDHKDGGKETGQLDALERAAWRIRCDLSEFTEAVAALTERGMIDERDGILYVTNYAKHHKRAPSASPEAVAKRVERHRARKAEESNEDVTDCNEGVTRVQRPETPLDTDTEQSRTDTETETEQKRADTAAEAEPKRAKPPPRDAAAVPGNALQNLLALGIDSAVAQKLIRAHPVSFILGWCAIAQERDNLSNPAGLVIAMLRDGIEPPELPERNEDWYTRDEYEQHILEPG